MKITVIGPGRWGSCIAWYLSTTGHDVLLYGQADAPEYVRFCKERKNDLLTLPDQIRLSCDLNVAIDHAQAIVISIPTQALQGLMEELKPYSIKNKYFVFCMKGIEISTGKRISQIASDNLDSSNPVSVWLGPGHPQEFVKGRPSCMVIDSLDEDAKKYLVKEFSSDLIRFYYGNDLIGNEIGGATKNVIGIAAGILDGLNLSSLKGPLMSRATREVARLIKAMGGNELSAYGLCHLGDYEATVFSQHSHNRKYGEAYVKGEKFEKLAEGYYTVDAVLKLAKKYDVELPICDAVYRVLYNGEDAKTALLGLFSRSIKQEF